MEALSVVIRFTADVSSMVRGAQEATRAVDDVSDAEERVTRTSAVASAGTAQLSFEFDGLGDEARDATRQIDQMNGVLARTKFMRSGGLLGGANDKGFATDIGSAVRSASNFAQGLIGALTLVAPTINIIIAGLIGIVSLLGAAVIAAAAFAAALGVTVAAMALAAYKWRDLLTQVQAGAETWKGALLAIEAEAFNMSKRLVASFSDASKAGKDLWTSVGEAGVKFLRMMEPVITSIVDHVRNFVDALNGVKGASSPFLEFLQTWIREWQVLLAIVNKDIPAGEGILGFFQKYEKPAKAFVEGIAEVINGIRKMSALGLGLNMDQLAEFIRNVFHFLAQLAQVFPKFSNALVTVGLELTRFLNAMLPIITASIELGAAILQNIVAPLVNLALVITSTILNLPIIRWFVELAGAMALVAFALAKLGPQSLTFSKVIVFMGAKLLWLANVAGVAVLKMLPALSGEMVATMAPFVGAIAILAAVAAAFFFLRGPLGQVGAMAKQTADTFKAAMTEMVQGAKTGTQVLVETYQSAADGFNKLSNIGKIIFGVQHFGDALAGTSVTAILTRESLDKLLTAYQEIGQELATGAATGSFTDDQRKELDAFRADYEKVQALIASGNVPTGVDVTARPSARAGITGEGADAAAQVLADYQQLVAGSDAWQAQLDVTNELYHTGIINAGQYATQLKDLYGSEKAAAEQVNITALEIKGASLTISQALLEVQKSGEVATGGLAQFATASGQSFVDLKTKALEAMNDLQGGLLGSGEKVTEFFMSQADVIAEWKTQTAEAFNFVTAAFQTLGSQADVTFGQIKTTLENAVQDAANYKKNLKSLRDLGASREVITMFHDAGPAFADMLAAWVSQGKAGVNDLDAVVKKGGEQGLSIANIFGDAMGVTMEKLTTAIELMISRSLGISFKRVQAMVEKKVDDVNNATGKLKDREVNIKVRSNVTHSLGHGMGSRSAGGAAVAAKAALPTPDLNAYREAYHKVGRAGASGLAQGLKDGQAEMEAAAAALGDASVKATKDAIGAHSPATEFISIGEDAVNGLIIGLQTSGPRLTATAYKLGAAMVEGLKNGIDGKMNALLVSLASQLAQIIAMVAAAIEFGSPSKVFRRFGESIGDGLRLGIRDSMVRVHADMRTHSRSMGKWASLDGHHRGIRMGTVGGVQTAALRYDAPRSDNRALRVTVALDRRRFGKDLGTEFDERGW